MHQQIPKLKSLINQLLTIPSISCTAKDIDQGNLNVIHLLADWFENFGFQCEIQTLAHDKNKANLIATLGKGNNGLVLAGHTDTVPYDDNRWQVDPFALTEKDNRFYGLGSCDMKSFFAVIIEALKDIELNNIKQPLIILATADEETSMSGAKVDLGTVVADQRTYLEDLMAAVKAEIDRGTHSPDKLRQIVKLPKYKDWRSYDEWLPMNIERIWAYYHMGW